MKAGDEMTVWAYKIGEDLPKPADGKGLTGSKAKQNMNR